MSSSTIQVIAELIAPLWLAARAVLLAIVVTFGLAVIATGAAAVLRRRGRPARRPRLRKFGWLAGWVTIGALALLTIAAETVLLGPIVRWATDRHPDTTIEFEAARGSFVFGRIELQGVHLVRRDPVRGSFDLGVATITFDFDAWRTLLGQHHRGELEAVGVRGTCSRDLDRFAARRDHELASLRIRDAEVDLQVAIKARSQSFALDIETMKIAPYRARHSFVDVACGATGSGTIEGSRFETERGQWRIERLPVHCLSEWAGGPLILLTGGEIDATITFRPDGSQTDRLASTIELEFGELRLGVPDDVGLTAGLALRPLVHWINAAPRGFAIDLDLAIDTAASDDPAEHRKRGRALRREFGFAIVDALAQKAGVGGSAWRRISAMSRAWFLDDDAVEDSGDAGDSARAQPPRPLEAERPR